MKILVLDDDKAVLASMQIQLQNRFSGDDQFWFCSDYDEYCKKLHDVAFDVLLLDILMPGQNGIDLAAQMITSHPEAAVIYFTGYPLEYCEAIFDGVKPFGYLKKPVDFDRLEMLLETLRTKKQEEASFSVTLRGQPIRLAQNDTIWLESHGRTVTIYCVQKHYSVYAKLSEMERQLPTFIRCHTSYLVNPQYIRSLKKDKFVVAGRETEIPISRKYLQQARAKFFEIKGNFGL